MGGDVLRGFTIERILSTDERTKVITVLGRFQDQEGRAVVTLRRRHFEEASLPRLLSEQTHVDLHVDNDVYTKYTGTVPPAMGQISIDIIYPATDKHISKHEDQAYFLVTETPKMYAAVVKPYIDSIQASRIQWVYNILDKKAEADRLIFEDADPEIGFLLHPDLKWDERQTEALYCIAMVNRRDVKSLRDLRGQHLPLLESILKQGTEAIMSRHEVAADQLRVFIHYQPSYYHLHVHFLHVKHDSGMGMAVGKAHLLSDVIGNIKLMGEYYKNCTLHTAIGEKDPLYALIRDQKKLELPGSSALTAVIQRLVRLYCGGFGSSRLKELRAKEARLTRSLTSGIHPQPCSSRGSYGYLDKDGPTWSAGQDGLK